MRQFKSTKNITDRKNLSVTNYLREVNRYPMISTEEEVALAEKIRNGGKEAEEARQRLVEANLRFVISVANQYHQKTLDLSDLISEGNIGLVKAAERFDDTKGFKFISYAVWWIRQSISAAVAEQEQTIRVPLNQRALIQSYHRLSQEMLQKEQRKPTVEEFAELANIDVDKACNLISHTVVPLSTDTPLGEDSDTTLGDFISGEYKTDAIVERTSLHDDIVCMLNRILSEREAEIIRCSFGIDTKEESIEVISERMSLSRERVRQIKEKSLTKLRDSKHIDLLTRYLG